jgi:hypothetical protein
MGATRRRRTRLLGLAVLVLVLAGAYVLYVKGRRAYRANVVCAQQVEGIQMALAMYAGEWGCFPDPDRWVDQVLADDPRLDVRMFKCPEDGSDARSSYGMNRALGGLDLDDILNADHLVSVYETAHPGDNPSGGAEDVASPPRHYSAESSGGMWLYKGNMYGYASGKLFGERVDLPRRPTFGPELRSGGE